MTNSRNDGNGSAPTEQNELSEFEHRGLVFKITRGTCFFHIKQGKRIVVRLFSPNNALMEDEIMRQIQEIKAYIDRNVNGGLKGLNIDWDKIKEA